MDATRATAHTLHIAVTPDRDCDVSNQANAVRYGIVRAAALDALESRNRGAWRWPSSRDARALTDLSRAEFSAGYRECHHSGRLVVRPNCTGGGTVTVIRMPGYQPWDLCREYALTRGRSTADIANAILRAIPYGRADLTATADEVLRWSAHPSRRTLMRALDDLASAGALSYELDRGASPHVIRARLSIPTALLPFVAPEGAAVTRRGH